MTWLYDILEQKITPSRSDDRAARSVGAHAGVRRVRPSCGGIYACGPPVFGRTTGRENDNLVPKRERDNAGNQPDGGLSHSLPWPLRPPKEVTCRVCGNNLRRWKDPNR